MIYGFSQNIRMSRYSWFLMGDFSSKTACVTTQKMKISEEILDEFEICFIDRFKSLLLHNHILRVQSMLVTDVEDKICLLIITYWT